MCTLYVYIYIHSTCAYSLKLSISVADPSFAQTPKLTWGENPPKWTG